MSIRTIRVKQQVLAMYPIGARVRMQQSISEVQKMKNIIRRIRVFLKTRKECKKCCIGCEYFHYCEEEYL